jgi:hypothetical protein
LPEDAFHLPLGNRATVNVEPCSKDCTFCPDPLTNMATTDNSCFYFSFNSLGKSYLSFNRGEDFLEINQSETRIACCGHAC